MKNMCWLLLACLPYTMVAQEVEKIGIRWQNDLTWQQAKQKATSENKYIFVDCYASWCGPCKIMDRYVYAKDTVGDYMNANFISIKLQMDSTKNDDAIVRSWYSTAKDFQKDYTISGFPTLLFFSPSGDIVHKYVGNRDVREMLVLADQAMDPQKQYYTLLKKYRAGNVDISDMPDFARMAKNIGEKELALQVAAIYTRQYVNQLPTDSLYSEHVLSFLRDFPDHIRSSDKIVRICYDQPEKVNRIMYNGYAKNVIDYFIQRDYFAPVLQAANVDKKDPNWDKLFTQIKSQFGEKYASNALLNVKPDYYKRKKDWKKYTVSLIEKVDKNLLTAFNDVNGALDLNNHAWEIFLFSKSKNELNKALKWAERALTLIPVSDSLSMGLYLDTKANLLYKLGRKQDAKMVQEKAVLMSPKDEVIKLNLVKMKKDEPTWNN